MVITAFLLSLLIICGRIFCAGAPKPLQLKPPGYVRFNAGQGLPIIEASRSHSDTTHSARLLWTSNQPDAETST
jgi:hypothetical protein